MKSSSKLSSIFILFVFFAGFVLATTPAVYHQHETNGNSYMAQGRAEERTKDHYATQSVAAQQRADTAMHNAGVSQGHADTAHGNHDHDGANYHFAQANHHMNTATTEQNNAIIYAGHAADASYRAHDHYANAEASYKAAADGRTEHTQHLQSLGIPTNGGHGPATAFVRNKETIARMAKQRNQ